MRVWRSKQVFVSQFLQLEAIFKFLTWNVQASRQKWCNGIKCKSCSRCCLLEKFPAQKVAQVRRRERLQKWSLERQNSLINWTYKHCSIGGLKIYWERFVRPEMLHREEFTRRWFVWNHILWLGECNKLLADRFWRRSMLQLWASK